MAAPPGAGALLEAQPKSGAPPPGKGKGEDQGVKGKGKGKKNRRGGKANPPEGGDGGNPPVPTIPKHNKKLSSKITGLTSKSTDVRCLETLIKSTELV